MKATISPSLSCSICSFYLHRSCWPSRPSSGTGLRWSHTSSFWQPSSSPLKTYSVSWISSGSPTQSCLGHSKANVFRLPLTYKSIISIKLINSLLSFLKDTLMDRIMPTLIRLWRMWEQKTQHSRIYLCKSSSIPHFIAKVFKNPKSSFLLPFFFQIGCDSLVL